MWPNPRETADLVAFTEEILNGKLFFCSMYSEPCQTSKTERFTEKPLTAFAKHSILDVWQGSEYASDMSFLMLE